MIDDLHTMSVAPDARTPADAEPIDAEPALDAEPIEAALADGRRHRFRPSHLVLVGATVALARWWFARDRVVFHLAPDEPAQLAVARTISGGPKWNMFDSITYRPGYGTVVSPVFFFTDDAHTAFRAVIVIGALMAGAAAVLLAWLVARLTSLSPVTCAVIAVLVAVAPASIATTAYTWSEPLVTLTFVATVCSLIRFRDADHSLVVAVAAVACAVAGFTTHSRLLPLVGTTLVLTCWPLARAKRWPGAGLVAAFGLVATASSVAYHRWILRTVWEEPASSNTAGSVLKRLNDPLAVLESLVGQAWYQVIATIGFAAIGTGAVVAASIPSRVRSWVRSWVRTRRHTVGSTDDPPAARAGSPIDTWGAQVIALSTVPLVLLSATFMSNRVRADQMIYGRYNDAVMWPMVALGLAWLAWRSMGGLDRRAVAAFGAVVAVGTALAVAVHVWNGDALADDVGLGPMVPGLLAYLGTVNSVSVGKVTAAAFVLFIIAVLAVVAMRLGGARARPAALAARAVAAGVAIGLLVVAAARVDDESARKRNAWDRASSVREVRDFVPEDSLIGVKFVRDDQDPAAMWVRQRQRFQLYQFFLPEYAFALDRGQGDGVGPFVFAPADDPGLIEAGATEVWTEPGEKLSLWLEPEAPSG